MANFPTTFEQKWPTVILTPIAVANHIITVSDTAGLHTKAEIVLSAIGQDPLELEIKRVLSDTQLAVGPRNGKLEQISNPVAYSGGTLTMSEQLRNRFGNEVVWRAVYEEEPATALRNVLVNRYGAHIDSVVRDDGKNALAVDATVSVVVPPVEVELDAMTPPDRDDPDNVLIVGSEDGTKEGIKRAFVNNMRQMILASHDRTQELTWADINDKKNRRIVRIDYTSAIIGATARKEFIYTLQGTDYVVSDINWTIL